MSSKTLFVTIIALFMLASLTTALTLTRAQRDLPKIGEVSTCSDSTPCGWAVYTPFSRRVDYFVKNTMCGCKPGRKCIRAQDDLSVSAYVYQCFLTENNSTPNPDS